MVSVLAFLSRRETLASRARHEDKEAAIRRESLLRVVGRPRRDAWDALADQYPGSDRSKLRTNPPPVA